MKRLARIAGIAIVFLLAVLVTLGISAKVLYERKITRVVRIDVAAVPYVNDQSALALGRYLYESRGCVDCHGANGGGRVVIEKPDGMLISGPNITAGPGGVVAGYTEADWVRTLRHGVNPAGHALLIMPSEDYSRWTDADLAALVAYVRNLPPATGRPGVVRLPFPAQAAYAFGVLKDASEKINHSLPPPQPIPVAATVEHGAYVANMCIGCHGPALRGGSIPGAPPDWPPAANLRPGTGSSMIAYERADQFKAMMRGGKRPDGSPVSKVMPFESLKAINDTDLDAMFAYLKTLPP